MGGEQGNPHGQGGVHAAWGERGTPNPRGWIGRREAGGRVACGDNGETLKHHQHPGMAEAV